MKRLLLSTALVAALMGSGVTAQTTATMPTITAPEGYARQDTALTVEQLLGATIYDANGDAVGEVQDLVFDAATVAASGAAMDAKPAGTVDDTGAMTTDGKAATDGTAMGTGTEGTTGTVATGTDTAQTGADTTGTSTTGADATQPDATAADTTTTGTDTADAGTGTDATGTEQSTAGTDAGGNGDTTATADPATGTGTGTEGAAAGTQTGTTGTTAGSDTTGMADATTATGTTAAPQAATGMATETAKITHAVLDVGGFLGMGEHRVAMPMEDLMLYTKGTDVRVYLAWTKEQMEAQASYDPNDSNTLGRSMIAPAN